MDQFSSDKARPVVRPFVRVYNKYLRSSKPESSASFYQDYVNGDDYVVEVGVWIGGGTLVLARLAREVYAFEPNPFSFEVLKHVTKQNSNVRIFNIALSDKDGKNYLNIGDDTSRSTPSDSLKKLSNTKYNYEIETSIAKIVSIRFPNHELVS